MSNNNTKTYCVYRVWNTITNKNYIGMTSTPLHKRMIKHFSKLKTATHRSNEMNNDYDLYGKSVFQYEEIESGLTENEASQIERFYVRDYNSINDGYNTREGGAKTSVLWDGIVYQSIKEASKELGISTAAIIHRVKMGYIREADLQYVNKPIPCVWNGIEYRSVNAASKACGISATSMTKRFNNGYTCDSDMIQRRK